MLLAVDTSTRWMGVALYDGVQVFAEQIWQTKYRHTIELAPAVQKILDGCGFRPDALKVLAIALGPGSFTGLRIGMALIKGLALGLRIPVVGIPSLDILAASQTITEHPLIAVLQAGRGRLAIKQYIAKKGKWSENGEAMLTTAKDLAQMFSGETLVCGELTAADRQTLKTNMPKAVVASPAQSMRRTSYLAELAWNRWQSGSVDDVATLFPIYLHVTEVIDA